ncbi:MAG: hypothetical protein V3V96_15460 [Acidiferrobacterales bacterium]
MKSVTLSNMYWQLARDAMFWAEHEDHVRMRRCLRDLNETLRLYINSTEDEDDE